MTKQIREYKENRRKKDAKGFKKRKNKGRDDTRHLNVCVKVVKDAEVMPD